MNNMILNIKNSCTGSSFNPRTLNTGDFHLDDYIFAIFIMLLMSEVGGSFSSFMTLSDRRYMVCFPVNIAVFFYRHVFG